MHANIEDVPLPNESFDMISIQFVLHEVPYENCLNILREAYRLLKQDGVLCIMDLNPKILQERFQESKFRLLAFEATEPHIYEYYQQNMVHSLEQCGFNYIEEYKNDPLNALYLATKSGLQVQCDYSFPRRYFFGNIPDNKKELTLIFT
jgi:ubiquinone/menaquinone biosynthesis C-methylase UbiE